MHREVNCIHTPIPGVHPREWPAPRAAHPVYRPGAASRAADVTRTSPPTS
ncbi:hypothetical protein RAJCM14343_1565 [Rhodococcus aetherivorans]|uniref:Uncharacterized protein n=1 Tax=Rhodococcus aetherivorans TaxID=191292 RepID=A0ABQ0YIJ9_9NOCA|nr:hypothetical protein RAJCM14343_1565 [Rhodococcus aetherivorans]